MKPFEPHKKPKSASRWVSLYHHQISAAGAPGRARLEGWSNLALVRCVVTLQREDEMAPWLPKRCEELGIDWLHFPLSGKKLQAKSDSASLHNLLQWAGGLAKPDAEPLRIVVHCSAGLHRTGVALYCLLRASGLPPRETLARIAQIRELTAEELSRNTRRSGRLVETAESWFATRGLPDQADKP